MDFEGFRCQSSVEEVWRTSNCSPGVLPDWGRDAVVEDMLKFDLSVVELRSVVVVVRCFVRVRVATLNMVLFLRKREVYMSCCILSLV